MILAAITQSVEVVLGEAATTQLPIVADWADVTATPSFLGGSTTIASNSTTPVTAVPAPAASTQRSTRYLNVYNADNVVHSVTVRYNDNSTLRILWSGQLAVSYTLSWTPEVGWTVTLSNAITQARMMTIQSVGF